MTVVLCKQITAHSNYWQFDRVTVKVMGYKKECYWWYSILCYIWSSLMSRNTSKDSLKQFPSTVKVYLWKVPSIHTASGGEQTLLPMLIQNILWILARYQLWLNLYCIWINFTSLPLNILQLLVHQIIFWFETIMDLLAYHHIVYASWLHSWRLKCYLQVGVVEQQVVRKRARKSYSPPTDPNWSDQWSLVSSCLINKYMIFYMFSS